MTLRWRGALALAVLISAGGCSHPSGYGDSYRAALRAQAAPPKRRTNAVEGLDSQEAAIIARAYHRRLAPKDEKPPEENMILVSPTSSSGVRQAPLQPSVPTER